MTISTRNIAQNDFVVTVQRYDAPRVSIGFHQFHNGQYAVAPKLLGRSDAVLEIEKYLDARFEEIDAYAVSQIEGDFYRLVKMSLPIEFHQGWIDGDQEMCDRIRVFMKPQAVYNPNVPHCSKELRFRDAPGLDGGGSVQCLSELLVNGTCPKTSLHHEVFYANRDRSKCYYGESHGGGCKH